jgi:hypothetical protein
VSGKTRTHFPEWLPDDGDKKTSRDRATIPQLQLLWLVDPNDYLKPLVFELKDE